MAQERQALRLPRHSLLRHSYGHLLIVSGPILFHKMAQGNSHDGDELQASV